MTAVRLGDRVRDRISGISGIAVSVTDWLYGCRRIGVQQEKLSKDGKRSEPEYFDEPQLEVLKVGAVLPPVAEPPKLVRRTGGPARETSGFER